NGMKRNRSRAPIVEALDAKLKETSTSFGVPGHRSGKGASPDVKKLLGEQVFRGDVSVQKGVDDRRERQQVEQRAEQLAAKAWGADSCYFSTNGSTLSMQAAILSVAAAGETVLVGRNAHKSIIAGLILAKVRPIFLEPEKDKNWDIEHAVAVETVRRALARRPNAKAVILTSPTYYGVSGNEAAIAK